jgi:putative ABC transport system permease protein
MSIGARGFDIMMQFLIESVFISVIGGVIGVIVGCLATWAISVFAGWPVVVLGSAIVLSFAVCTITGIFFGWVPAVKASRLDPIEAIRYE